MNKHYIGFLAILVLALLLFGYLSFWDEGIDLGEHHMKTATFAETLLTPPDTAVKQTTVDNTTPVAQAAGSDSSVVAQTTTDGVVFSEAPHYQDMGQQPMDTTSKVILFIGDSMLEGLGPRLAAYAKENGHTLINVIWYSSTTEIWGRTTRLQERIQEFHPNYIFVCLGANELFVGDIQKKRQKYLNNMLAQIGNIPYVWIGPPNWKPDTGINDMLQASCAPGSFYLSNGEHFDRAKDGAHPTRASAAAWCDRVCKWVMTKGAHPIKLERPSEAKARCRTIVYQPDI